MREELKSGDARIPQLISKVVHIFRELKEEVNIERYVNLVLAFVKVATKATYPLEMLQSVANPSFLQILLKILFQVSIKLKLKY